MDNVIKVVEKSMGGIFQCSVFSLLFMAVLIAGDLIMRNLFEKAIPDCYEFTSMLLIVLISATLPLTSYQENHVTVTLFRKRFGHGLRSVCDVISSAVGAIVFGMMSVEMISRGLYSMKAHVTLGYLGLPEYPFRFVFTVGCFLTAVAYLFLLIEVLLSWHKKVGYRIREGQGDLPG